MMSRGADEIFEFLYRSLMDCAQTFCDVSANFRISTTNEEIKVEKGGVYEWLDGISRFTALYFVLIYIYFEY